MRRFKRWVICILVLIPLLYNGAGQPLFAQTGNLEDFAENLEFGTVEVKRSTLQALRRMASRDASRVAIRGLSDASEIVRATAISAVVYLPGREAVSLVVPFLGDKSPFIRKEAAYALGEIGAEEAAPPLIEALRGGRKTEVRAAAAVALGQIGNISAIGALNGVLGEKAKKSRFFLRRSAARALGQIAESVTNRPVSYNTPDSFLPEELKTALKPGDVKTPGSAFQNSIPLLEKILRDRKESADTRREAAFALGAIGDDRSAEILRMLSASEDYYLAEICREALHRISGS